MTELLTLRNLLWLTTAAAEAFLLFSLLQRKLQNLHPIFLSYIACTLVQSALAAFVYGHWELESKIASRVIWSSQAVVISMRFAAVIEMARRIFSKYIGLWSLAKRVLGVIGAVVLGYSVLMSKRELSSVVLNLDRGLELAIATCVVSLLLFSRFYLLPVQPFERALAVGFSMYSCFYVVNDTLFEKLAGNYLAFWGYLDIITFLASLLIWTQAVRTLSRVPMESTGRVSFSRGQYGVISPELNVRLNQLNEHLSHLLRAEKGNS